MRDIADPGTMPDKTPITKLIGIRIRDLRTQKGLTQQDLAEKAGVTQAKLSHYELGTKQPTISSLEKIAEGLGVSITELLKE